MVISTTREALEAFYTFGRNRTTLFSPTPTQRIKATAALEYIRSVPLPAKYSFAIEEIAGWMLFDGFDRIVFNFPFVPLSAYDPQPCRPAAGCAFIP